jgi:hypothetical protein
MTSIQFFLKVTPREPFVNLHELNMLQGGLQIIINDTIVTRYTDEQEDPGFRGGMIYYILSGFLNCIPTLFTNKKCTIPDMSSGGLFIFTPRGELTCVQYLDFEPAMDLNSRNIRIMIAGEQKVVSCESQNRRYPNYPDGTCVYTVLLAKEIIKICDEFLRHLESMKESPDEYIDRYRELLITSKKVLDNYPKYHPEIIN